MKKVQLLLTMFAGFLLLSGCTGNKEKNDETQRVVSSAPAQTIDIKEWAVPWENTGTRDPFVAPDGKVWFCGQRGNYIAFLVPGTGEFKRYELEEGTHPHNLIVDDSGFVWYAGNQNAHIGKLDPADGAVTKFAMPDTDARDPHTLVFDRGGNIWFTVQGGNFVGHLNTTSGKVRLISVPTPGARPYGIKMNPQGQPWVVLFGTNKLARIDPATFELTEVELPNKESRPRRIEIAEDGSIFYGDYSRGYLGKYSPADGKFVEWPLPGGEDSEPYGTAQDQEGRIWVAESGVEPNRLVGFDPEKEEFFSITEIPSGGETIRHMYFHPSTREIWFGTDTNNIGRAVIEL